MYGFSTTIKPSNSDNSCSWISRFKQTLNKLHSLVNNMLRINPAMSVCGVLADIVDLVHAINNALYPDSAVINESIAFLWFDKIVYIRPQQIDQLFVGLTAPFLSQMQNNFLLFFLRQLLEFRRALIFFLKAFWKANKND